MQSNIIVLKYLQALKEQVDPHQFKDILRELIEVAQEMLKLKDTMAFLVNPVAREENKVALIKQVFLKHNISKQIKNLFLLLIQNKRINLLSELLDVAKKELQLINKKVPAQIYTADDLSDKAKKLIIQSIKKISGKDIDPVFEKSASILGGFKVYIENNVYDATVNNTLGKLKEKIN